MLLNIAPINLCVAVLQFFGHQKSRFRGRKRLLAGGLRV